MGAPSDRAPLQLVCNEPPAICQVQFRLLPGAGSRWTSCPWVSTLVRHNAHVCLFVSSVLRAWVCSGYSPCYGCKKGCWFFQSVQVFAYCLYGLETFQAPSTGNWKSTILIPLSMGISFQFSTLRNKLPKEREIAQLCLTLCNPMDCSLPVSFIYGIFQARILEWVAMSFSRGSSWPRDQTWVSHIAGRLYYLSHQGILSFRAHTLLCQWSPNFLAPGTSFVKTVFPWTVMRGGDSFRMTSSTLHLLCTSFLI